MLNNVISEERSNNAVFPKNILLRYRANLLYCCLCDRDIKYRRTKTVLIVYLCKLTLFVPCFVCCEMH